MYLVSVFQEKYGMTSNGGYTKQFNEKMNKQVGRNVSIGDYFQKKANMMCSMMTGEDSYETRTTGKIKALSQALISFLLKLPIRLLSSKKIMSFHCLSPG